VTDKQLNGRTDRQRGPSVAIVCLFCIRQSLQTKTESAGRLTLLEHADVNVVARTLLRCYLRRRLLFGFSTAQTLGFSFMWMSTVPVSVWAKLSFIEPGRRWAHSPSTSKAPGISYQGTMKTSVRMLKTSGGL